MFIRCLPLGPLETNAYIVAHEAGYDAIVIDPGGPPDEILQVLDDNGFRLKAIIVTHAHGDHIAGIPDLKQATGAPVWVHEADAAMLTDPEANLLAWTGMEEVPTAPPDRVLRDGDAVVLDDESPGAVILRVVHTPGHSPGGISVIGDGFVFCGDTLFAGGIGRTDFPGGSERQLMQSIREKLLTLADDTIVYPGHGPETSIGHERKYNQYLM